MPRALNTHDTFTAIAEPKRRVLIETLIGRELSVNQVVEITQWRQPMVSKHLSVLKQAGLVSERKVGRQRVYKLNANELKPIQLWIAQFEKHWNEPFDQLNSYLVELQSCGLESSLLKSSLLERSEMKSSESKGSKLENSQSKKVQDD